MPVVLSVTRTVVFETSQEGKKWFPILQNHFFAFRKTFALVWQYQKYNTFCVTLMLQYFNVIKLRGIITVYLTSYCELAIFQLSLGLYSSYCKLCIVIRRNFNKQSKKKFSQKALSLDLQKGNIKTGYAQYLNCRGEQCRRSRGEGGWRAPLRLLVPP